MSSHCIIIMTNRPPVRIPEDRWPVIAEGTDDSFDGGDDDRYEKACGRGELDLHSIRVRQHADGRAIVYGVLNAAIADWLQPARGESRRGGELLPAGADLAAALRRVGESIGLSRYAIESAIADLPPENLG